MIIFPISLLVNRLTTELHQSGIEKQEAIAQAWLLITTLSKKNKAQLFAKGSVQFTQEELEKLAGWIKAITHQYKPLAYLIGEVPFLDLMLTVRHPVLIPRPETEEWGALLIEIINRSPSIHCVATPTCFNSRQNTPFARERGPRLEGWEKVRGYSLPPLIPSDPKGCIEGERWNELHILDLCTGSGCIALALAKAFPQSHVWGGDISEKAIELAQENALRNNITNATFICSNLWEKVPKNLSFDLIVANPPYILPDEFEQLPPHIKEWEDRRALVDEEEGLGVTKKLIKYASDYLKPSSPVGELWIEIHHCKGNEVMALMAEQGFTNLAVIKDSAGLSRVVRGKR